MPTYAPLMWRYSLDRFTCKEQNRWEFHLLWSTYTAISNTSTTMIHKHNLAFFLLILPPPTAQFSKLKYTCINEKTWLQWERKDVMEGHMWKFNMPPNGPFCRSIRLHTHDLISALRLVHGKPFQTGDEVKIPIICASGHLNKLH
jgi:hypothetical protein